MAFFLIGATVPALNQDKKLVPVASPLKGINRVMNREGQPPDTCWDALNMLPYDRFGRKRVAQRPGLSQPFLGFNSSNPIQCLQRVNSIIYPALAGTVPTVANGGIGGVPIFTVPQVTGTTITFPGIVSDSVSVTIPFSLALGSTTSGTGSVIIRGVNNGTVTASQVGYFPEAHVTYTNSAGPSGQGQILIYTGWHSFATPGGWPNGTGGASGGVWANPVTTINFTPANAATYTGFIIYAFNAVTQAGYCSVASSTGTITSSVMAPSFSYALPSVAGPATVFVIPSSNGTIG